jgi:hypothetical protein
MTTTDEQWLARRAKVLRQELSRRGYDVDAATAGKLVDTRRQELAGERGLSAAQARRCVTDKMLELYAVQLACAAGATVNPDRLSAPEVDLAVEEGSEPVVALHSVGPTGKPRFDGAMFGPVLVALIEAAKVHAFDNACATLDVLAVAGRFADNIRLGLETQASSMNADDLSLAELMLRTTADRLTAGRDDDDDVAIFDQRTARTLHAAAGTLRSLLDYVR